MTPDLTADLPIAEVISALWPAAVGRAAGWDERARAGDVDAVHELRIATKRLFELWQIGTALVSGKRRRRIAKELTSLSDVLGRVRDVDARALVVADLAGRAGRPKGLDAWEAADAAARAQAIDDLAAHLDRIRDDDAWERWRRAASSDRNPPLSAGSAVSRAARRRLDAVREAWDQTTDRPSPRRLHAMRIANRRLRYAIEPFAAWLPEEAAPVLSRGHRLHDALGALHDHDQLRPRVLRALFCAEPGDRASWEPWLVQIDAARRRHTARVLTAAEPLAAGGWRTLEAALEALDA